MTTSEKIKDALNVSGLIKFFAAVVAIVYLVGYTTSSLKTTIGALTKSVHSLNLRIEKSDIAADNRERAAEIRFRKGEDWRLKFDVEKRQIYDRIATLERLISKKGGNPQ